MQDESAKKTMRQQLNVLMAKMMVGPSMVNVTGEVRDPVKPPDWSLQTILRMPALHGKNVAVMILEEFNMVAFIDPQNGITHAEIYNPPRSLLEELDKII